MARRPRGAARAPRRGRLRRLADRGRPAGCGSNRRRRGRLRRARDVRRRAGSPLPACLRARPGSRCGSTATSSRRSARCRSPSSSARGRSTTSRRRARPGSRRSPPVTSWASSYPSPRSISAGRCRLPARSSTPELRSLWPPTSTREARTARACRSCARSRARSSDLTPAEALAACTVNAAYVLGLRRPRSARARAPRRPRARRRLRLAASRVSPCR